MRVPKTAPKLYTKKGLYRNGIDLFFSFSDKVIRSSDEI